MGKTILITGANQGLGFHAASNLVQQGHCVLFACRNLDAAKTAAAKLNANVGTNGNGNGNGKGKAIVLDDVPLDLASLDAVRKYASAVETWLDSNAISSSLDALVLNAGLGGTPTHTITADGFDLIFEGNCLGHFLLTLLLLPRLAQNARVISVSSEVHDTEANNAFPDPASNFASTDEEWERIVARGEPFPNESGMMTGGRRYARSKLLNVLFANQLARVLSGAVPAFVEPDVAKASETAPGNKSCSLPHAVTISSTAMNPSGMLDSGFVTSAYGWLAGQLMYLFTPALKWFGMARTAAQSGLDLAKLTVDPEFQGISAAYFDGAKQVPSSKFSREMETVVKRQVVFWEKCLVWAKVTEEEKKKAGL